MVDVLKVGFGRVDLRPPLGGSMPGYFSDRKADGTLDPLLASAFVFQYGTTTLAVIALDLIGIAAPMVAACRKSISATTGIPAKNILIHASHTHTGAALPRPPQVQPPKAEADTTKIVYPGDPDPEWVRAFPDRVATAVREATAGIKISTMKLGSTYAPGLAFIRRFEMKDGTYRTNPGYGNPEILEPIGEPDPTVTVAGFPGIKAAIVIFGVHPDVIGGTKYSADWPHHVRESFRANVGADWNVMVLNAACGNINHIDVLNPKQAKGYPESTRIGKTIGIAASEAWKKAQNADVTGIGISSLQVESKIREVPEADLVEAKRIVKEEPAKAQPFNGLHANSAIALATTEEKSQLAEIMAIRLGPLGLVGMPGEIFVELARMVQHDSPFEPTRVIGLCNGAMGYIPHEEGYRQGGYEAGYRSARFAPGTGERWATEALKLLNTLG